MAIPHNVTLDEAVSEVLNYLTGLDLHYVAELDRYRSITRNLNRALRLVATEHEWSYYSAIADMGALHAGQTSLFFRTGQRPRIILDDSIRLVDDDNNIRMWAYYLARESLHKYRSRPGLWVAVTQKELTFSRPIPEAADGLRALVPVMRNPKELQVPNTLESVDELTSNPPVPTGSELLQLRNFTNPEIIEEWVFTPGLPPYEFSDPEHSLSQTIGNSSSAVRNQLIDFDFPDLIVLKAALLYAQTDPIMQPRVPTLEGQYKNLFYALTERDTNHTDDPYINEWSVPMQSSIRNEHHIHSHPHGDERKYYNYQ